MRIHVIADRSSDWYPKNAITAFGRYSTFEFVDRPRDADLIWIFSYYMPLDGIMAKSLMATLLGKPARRRRGLEGIPVIATVHHLVPQKEREFLPRIRAVDAAADAVQFFSKPNVDLCKKYFTRPIFTLPYWIDLELFTPVTAEAKAALRRKLDLPGDRMIIGSFQRDTEQDLVTPKLEKGPDLFCDVVEGLDRDRVMVLLAGVRRDYVEKRLTAAGIPFKNVGRVAHEQMADLYRCLDAYLVTSRYEGGPQAILECMATATPIYSTYVGVADALDPSVICPTVADFIEALQSPYPDVVESHLEVIKEFEIRNAVARVEATLRGIVEGYRISPNNLRQAAGVDWRA